MKKQGRTGKRKIIVGLTGSFGSGKSTVARIFGSYGAKVIDADRIAHALIKPGAGAYKKIINAFGSGILMPDKTINRRRLAGIVFSNKRLLKRLNGIVHPGVIGVIRKKIKTAPARVIILDAPLLIEARLAGIADKLIVVTITRKKQIERISRKTGMSSRDILKRIKAQIPLSNKIRLADFVIDNSQTLEKTKKQAGKIRRLLWRN